MIPRVRRCAALLLLLVVASPAALVLPGCASPKAAPTPRQNLDPLYHGATGEGVYEVDPTTAALARRAPARTPPPPSEAQDPQKPCDHDWTQITTHLYTDSLTGMPALCAVQQCRKCGKVVHDCQRRWSR